MASKTTAEPGTVKPDADGRLVYMAAGRVVVFPKGVVEAPLDYKGSIGIRPFALVKLGGKVAGEIYCNVLKGTAAAEADEMAGSISRMGKASVRKRASEKVSGVDAEVTVLDIEANSNFGQTWVFHSVYIPKKKDNSSTTFKLVASKADYEAALLLFQEMLFPAPEEDEKK